MTWWWWCGFFFHVDAWTIFHVQIHSTYTASTHERWTCTLQQNNCWNEFQLFHFESDVRCVVPVRRFRSVVFLLFVYGQVVTTATQRYRTTAYTRFTMENRIQSMAIAFQIRCWCTRRLVIFVCVSDWAGRSYTDTRDEWRPTDRPMTFHWNGKKEKWSIVIAFDQNQRNNENKWTTNIV